MTLLLVIAKNIQAGLFAYTDVALAITSEDILDDSSIKTHTHYHL